MPETGTSGSMSGMWKRSMVRLLRHRQTKGPATDRPNLTHRATSRLHHLDSTEVKLDAAVSARNVEHTLGMTGGLLISLRQAPSRNAEQDPLASNPVIQLHNAIWERTRGNQFERDIPMARSDERNPLADHYGNDVDREFIDRACV